MDGASRKHVSAQDIAEVCLRVEALETQQFPFAFLIYCDRRSRTFLRLRQIEIQTEQAEKQLVSTPNEAEQPRLDIRSGRNPKKSFATS